MKHNNQIPNNHFRKHWQTRVRTWFNQAGRKKSRRLHRLEKSKSGSAKPIRPVVQCPTIKYNIKQRFGRGFTLEELKAAKVSVHVAKSYGIPIDHRRRNVSADNLALNKARLSEFIKRAVKVTDNSSDLPKSQDLEFKKLDFKKNVNSGFEQITEDMRNFNAYMTLRKARGIAHHHGIRAKRAALKADEDANTVKTAK